MVKARNTKVPEDMVAGSIHETNSCGMVEVVSYIKKGRVKVRFLNTGFEDVVMSTNIRSGGLKDKLMPSVEGVGFFGVGEYVSKIKGIRTPQYSVWRSMFLRCYSKRTQIKQPTYIGCTVCDEWHNFQNFAKWFDENYIDGFALDKDIRIDDNRVYSPDTCKFVSAGENTEKAKAKDFLFVSPDGDKVKIHNLTRFCVKNGLQQSNMQHVYSGARKSHKGWTKA